MKMIEVSNLSKRFGELRVFDGVNFSVEQGETVAIIGPSGAGKSTMLRCLINLEKADEGTVFIKDEPLVKDGKYGKDRQSRQICASMGMVFQNFNLFPHMSVLGNLIASPVTVSKQDKTQAKVRAMKLLDMVGLADKAEAKPSELSGGQAQRVAIARSLMRDPEVLLFDEPTSALDPQLTAEVLSVMRKLHEQRMTMVIVTHEMGFAREVADKILFMADGGVLACGTPEEIFDRPTDVRIKEFIDSILTV